MGQRVDGIHDFWDDFREDGMLEAAPPRMGVDGRLDEPVRDQGGLPLRRP